MAFVTPHMQGSYGAFPLRSMSWSRGTKLIQCATTTDDIVNRSDNCVSMNSSRSLSLRGPIIRGSIKRTFKISAFKSNNTQNDEFEGKTRRPMVPKNSVELSFVPQESEDMPKESLDVNQSIAGSHVMHYLFKKCFSMFHTQSPSNAAKGFLQKKTRSIEDLDTQNESQIANKQMFKRVWLSFLSLDITVKIPILIFIPGFIAITFLYGADVSKELMPLWILGPLIAALYIKLIQAIFALYVFSFKQTVRLVMNAPSYSRAAFGYIAHGKLKQDLRTLLWKPLEELQNLDYRNALKMRASELWVWIVEKYWDYVESVWPLYCRVIRFLKKSGLI